MGIQNIPTNLNKSLLVTSAGTFAWTVPPNVTMVLATVQGAGQGGAGGGAGGIITTGSGGQAGGGNADVAYGAGGAGAGNPDFDAGGGGGGAGGRSGALIYRMPIMVIPNSVVSGFIGSGGSGTVGGTVSTSAFLTTPATGTAGTYSRFIGAVAPGGGQCFTTLIDVLPASGILNCYNYIYYGENGPNKAGAGGAGIVSGNATAGQPDVRRINAIGYNGATATGGTASVNNAGGGAGAGGAGSFFGFGGTGGNGANAVSTGTATNGSNGTTADSASYGAGGGGGGGGQGGENNAVTISGFGGAGGAGANGCVMLEWYE